MMTKMANAPRDVRIAGEVKWFNKSRGYGFIISDEIDGDIFVHFSQIEGNQKFKELQDGERVTCLVVPNGHKGFKAESVVRVGMSDTFK